jgi:hypothetical protein
MPPLIYRGGHGSTKSDGFSPCALVSFHLASSGTSMSCREVLTMLQPLLDIPAIVWRLIARRCLPKQSLLWVSLSRGFLGMQGSSPCLEGLTRGLKPSTLWAWENTLSWCVTHWVCPYRGSVALASIRPWVPDRFWKLASSVDAKTDPQTQRANTRFKR